jgi:16S rRNA (uracil1498-N3)-methyltransferase
MDAEFIRFYLYNRVVSRRRWIADEWSGDRAAITGQNARHLSQVLRAKIGQTFELAHAGQLRLGTIATIDDERIIFSLGEAVPTAAAHRQITIALAVFKFDRFEWAIEKVTELGAARIVPVIAQRTDVHLVKAAEKRVERWRRIAHEASQQSRRSVEPMIEDPITLKRATQELGGQRVVFSENERSVAIVDLNFTSDVTLAIGPEGGWTAAEEDGFAAAGWESASLGATVLRAETAAIAAMAIVSAMR